MDLSRLGEKIKRAREDAGFESPADLAHAIRNKTNERITSQAIYNWEKGINLPGVVGYVAMCILTGKGNDFFFGPEFVYKSNGHTTRPRKPAIKSKKQGVAA